jgi:hypothetical protein
MANFANLSVENRTLLPVFGAFDNYFDDFRVDNLRERGVSKGFMARRWKFYFRGWIKEQIEEREGEKKFRCRK